MSSSGCAGYYLPVLRILYEAWRVKGTGPGTPLRNGRQNIAASSRYCPSSSPQPAPAAPWRTRPAGGAGRRASAVREALYVPLLAIACTAVPATSAGQRSGLAVQPQALCFASSRRRRKNPWSPPSQMTAPSNSPLPSSHIAVTKPKPPLPVDTSPVMRLGALAENYLGIPECCGFSSRCSSNTWLL